ncbi:hypothetical protein E2C01_070615 [Portunus trituberculatus]|uniref:Secreted protein n=1 Tax=Portunus trituberculatus TaxID=210409 RepID=A0A5B7I5Q8_PORTR|nr:hypothetical protein [Portunus trituberculatus]
MLRHISCCGALLCAGWRCVAARVRLEGASCSPAAQSSLRSTGGGGGGGERGQNSAGARRKSKRRGGGGEEVEEEEGDGDPPLETKA